jgi:hypothetical protein
LVRDQVEEKNSNVLELGALQLDTPSIVSVGKNGQVHVSRLYARVRGLGFAEVRSISRPAPHSFRRLSTGLEEPDLLLTLVRKWLGTNRLL